MGDCNDFKNGVAELNMKLYRQYIAKTSGVVASCINIVVKTGNFVIIVN